MPRMVIISSCVAALSPRIDVAFSHVRRQLVHRSHHAVALTRRSHFVTVNIILLYRAIGGRGLNSSKRNTHRLRKQLNMVVEASGCRAQGQGRWSEYFDRDIPPPCAKSSIRPKRNQLARQFVTSNFSTFTRRSTLTIEFRYLVVLANAKVSILKVHIIKEDSFKLTKKV